MLKQKIICVFIPLLITMCHMKSNMCYGQVPENRTSYRYGFESEVMCWINKGYHGSFWIGKGGLRARLVIAKATYPDYLNPEGFTNLTSRFYEVEIDYFFGKKRKDFRGIWYALGTGYTQQTVESKSSKENASIHLFDLHTGIGYALSIYKGLYINPWIGIDLHLNTPKNVRVGKDIWEPRYIDPVLGVKIGYSF